MEAVREITVWKETFSPNHDYLLDGDRVVAYRPWGTGEIQVLSGKLKIDRRGRKFVKLDPNPFAELDKKKESLVVEVKGSKGEIYYVDPEAKTCTCKGFQFRGSCRHLAENS